IQNEREWSVFCRRVLGRPAFATAPEFASNGARVAHRAVLTTAIAAAFAGCGAAELLAVLDEVGIANAHLRDMSSFADHPQLRARDRWREFGSPVGVLEGLLPPGILDGEDPVMGPVPGLGEHTEAVLAEIGLSPAGGDG